jgi:transposase
MAQPMVQRWLLPEAVWGFRYSSERYGATGYLPNPRWWNQHRGKKGGAGIGYSGHKHQKGDKELTIVDNNGFVLGPITVKPVNQQDIVILPESLTKLVTFTEQIGLELEKSSFTLDSGFDSKANKDLIKEQKLVPIIKPNRRNTKEPIAIARLYRWFDKELYKERYKVERTFGWQDTYRRLAISYDRLEEIRLGFRHLAYAMINFRVTFNTS